MKQPLSPRPCPNCHADLILLAGEARFCPTCGTRLGDAWRASMPVTPTAPASAQALHSSLILRGYANAMCHLGHHYEARHNEREAARCYDKAARLGSLPARARLLDPPVLR